MKANYFKAILLLVTFLTASSSFSQTVYSERYPKMRFGLNMGGIWQTNDILKNKAGFAGGVTLEKVLNKKDDAILGFSLGLRYLGGYSKGYDNRKNIALKSNTALNTADSTTNYFTSPGYFYNNYRTSHNEGALELKMNFPKFEKRTSLVFHLFGGVGAAKYNTKINALDFESKYNFSNFNAGQPSLSEVQKMYDFTWETPADGNAGNGNIVLAPSAGFGFGVRFSKNFSWVIEHRVTFPRVDVLDGQQWKDDATKTSSNDYYHYTSAHFIFTFYGGGKGNISNYNNTNVTTNTNTNTNAQTNLNSTPKPIINVYTPVTNPYTTTSNVQQVSGTIKYVTAISGVSVSVNGVPNSNFNFNPNNGSISFNANLNPGANNVTITATNAAGQDSETLQINYSAPQFTNQPVITELPPKVVITYPSNNYLSTIASTNVNAVISNINSSSNIALSVNGTAISNFNYNSFSGALNFVAPLIAGNNSIVVSAFNSAGNDAQQVFVKYTPTSTAQVITPRGETKPVVSFHNPSSSPFESAVKPFNVTAHVSNVTSANQITVVYNGVPVPNFTFNSYGFVNFNVNLNVGSNSIVITGTNTAGSDVKTATLNYKETGLSPIVTIIEPSNNPFVTEAVNANVVAKIEHVQNQSNITVMLNNAVVPFVYNTINQTATIQANLNPGKNNIVFSAVNSYGSDSKTQVIERSVKAVRKPLITIINPAVSPFATFVSTQQVVAQVLNVSSSAEIQVKGQANLSIPFTYDAITQQILFSVNLVSGANPYTIIATNTGGSDTKTVTINYTPKAVPVLTKPPVVTFINPVSSPSSTFDASINVIATALNVASQQELTIKLNGANVNFTFDAITKEIVIPTSLLLGSNSITITATNIGGSDSKTQIIERKEMTRCLLSPVVNIIRPQPIPFNTQNATENVQAEVLNVTGASNIQVTNQSGQSVNFTYDNLTHYVNFSASLVAGSNVFVVKATNSVNSASESVNIIYTKVISTTQIPVKVKKPVVTFSIPAQVNSTIAIATQPINATVTNVSAASDVAVQVNGQAYTGFTFVNGAVTFVLNCNEGTNTVSVTGTNLAGSDSKTIFVNYVKPAPPLPPPVVTIVSPVGLVTSATALTHNVQASISNITSSSQVEVRVNGSLVNNFTYSNGNVSFVANLNGGLNTVLVKGTNNSGTDSKTISILYEVIEQPVVINPPVLNYLIPSSASLTTSNATENIRMTVTNVNLSSQVSVKVNGINVPNFTLNYGVINFNAGLSLGVNTILVTASNNGGLDSKQILVNYELPPIPAPVVTILMPAQTSTTTTASQSVEASISNVTSASQVQVTINGAAFSGFNYTNGNVSLITSLDAGANTISIKGTNVSGSDIKTVVVNYTAPVVPVVVLNPPVVTFINPSAVSSSVNVSTQSISATVTNALQNEISVKVNGSTISNFTFSNSTINFVASLNQGANTVQITATNAQGTDTKSITINYTPPAPIVNPPVVNITNPSATSSTLSNVQNVSATATEVINASQVSVVVNNTTISSFTFVNGNISFVAPLSVGSNVVKVTATNSAGSDSKTITVTRLTPPAPAVSITNPANNPYTSTTANVNVTATVINVAGASEINVSTGGSVVPFTYNPASNVLNFSYVLTGNTTFVVSASNNNGSDSKSLVVNYTIPVVDPDIVICHKPPGNPTNTQQLTIPQSAWAAHQAHGDVLGTCPPAVTTPTVTPDPDIVICHKPPGNPTNTQQLTIPQSAWAAHQAHGDVLGACPTQVNPPVVSISNPSSQNSTTVNTVQNVSAAITEVTSSSQVNILVNGTSLNSFTFNNGNVSFVAALSMGSNTIRITGTNEGGSDAKTITVTRQAPPAPLVTITKPSDNPFTSNDANINIKATVLNVAYASEINVTAGGSVIPFNYNVASDVLTIDYVLTGNTTFVITASNANGSDSKNLVVSYALPVVDPDIVICHKPPGNPTNTQQLTIPQSAWAAHQAHGDELGACPPAVTTPTVTPDPDIVICHKPPGNPTNTQQLTIPQSAWAAHQAHGDELGACPTPTVTPNNGTGNNNGNNNNDPEIVICHKPPGNPTNTQELTIPQSAWPAHQAHGDDLGPCPKVKGNNGGGNNNGGTKNTGGTILNGIKGILTTPTNTSPKTNTNTQPTVTPPKKEEQKKEEPKVIPRTGPTTNTVAPAPTSTPKATTPSTVTEESKGTSTPRVIKPR